MGVFNCNKCNKTFTNKRDFNAHQKLHSCYDSIRCSICRSICIRQTDLQLHLKLIHNIDSNQSTEMKVQCKECGEHILKGAPLRMHMNLHKEMICKICGMTFTNRQELKRHKNLNHNAERCVYCQETFENISQHMENCLSRNLECKKCKSVFENHFDLQCHLKKSSCGIKRSIGSHTDETSLYCENSEFKDHRFVGNHGDFDVLQDGSEMDINSTISHDNSYGSKLEQCDSLSNEIQNEMEKSDTSICNPDKEKISMLALCGLVFNEKQVESQTNTKSNFSECRSDDNLHVNREEKEHLLRSEANALFLSDDPVKCQSPDMQQSVINETLSLKTVRAADNSLMKDLSYIENDPYISSDDNSNIDLSITENGPNNCLVEDFNITQNNLADKSSGKYFNVAEDLSNENGEFTQLKNPDSELGVNLQSPLSRIEKIDVSQKIGIYPLLSGPEIKNSAASQECSLQPLVNDPRTQNLIFSQDSLVLSDNVSENTSSGNLSKSCDNKETRDQSLMEMDSETHVNDNTSSGNLSKSCDIKETGDQSLMETDSETDSVVMEKNMNTSLKSDSSKFHDVEKADATKTADDINVSDVYILQTEKLNLYPEFLGLPLLITKNNVSMVTVYKCVMCDGVFLTLSLLYDHCQQKHPKCDICGKRFNSKDDCGKKSTINTRHPYRCKVCLELYKLSLSVHSKVQSGTLITDQQKCHLCDRSFKNFKLLDLHSRIHTQFKPHVCHLCGKKFMWKKSLSHHLNLHNGAKPYKCAVCERLFSGQRGIELHVRHAHGTESSAFYQCEKCGHKFLKLYNLEKHLIKHTKLKEYECSKCGKKFMILFNLKSHIVRTHKDVPYLLQKYHEKSKQNKKNKNSVHDSERSDDEKSQGHVSTVEVQRAQIEAQKQTADGDQGQHLLYGISKMEINQGLGEDIQDQVQEIYKGQSSSEVIGEMDQDQSSSDDRQYTTEHNEEESRFQSIYDDQTLCNFQGHSDQSCDRLDETDGNICQGQGQVNFRDKGKVSNPRHEFCNDIEKDNYQKKQNVTEGMNTEHQEQCQTIKYASQPRKHKKKTQYFTVRMEDKVMRVKYHSGVCKMSDEFKDRHKWLHGEVIKTCMDLVNDRDVDQVDSAFRRKRRRGGGGEGGIMNKNHFTFSNEFNYYQFCDFEKNMKKEKNLTEEEAEAVREKKSKSKDEKKKRMDDKKNNDERLSTKEAVIDGESDVSKCRTDKNHSVKNVTHVQVSRLNNKGSNSGCHGNSTEIIHNDIRFDTHNDISLQKHNKNSDCHGNSLMMKADLVKMDNNNCITCDSNLNHSTNKLHDIDRKDLHNLFTALRKKDYLLLQTLTPGGYTNCGNQKHITDSKENSKERDNYNNRTGMGEDKEISNCYTNKTNADSVMDDNLKQAHVTTLKENRTSREYNKDIMSHHKHVNTPSIQNNKDQTPFGEDRASSEHNKHLVSFREDKAIGEQDVMLLRRESKSSNYQQDVTPIIRKDSVRRNDNNEKSTEMRDGILMSEKHKEVTGMKGDNSGSAFDKLSLIKRKDEKDKMEVTSRDFPPRTISKIEGSKDYLQSNFILHNIGRLYPRHTATDLFHTRDYIYPVGYRASRSFWSMRQQDKSCRYICSITDKGGHPQFVIEAMETGLSNVIFRGSSIRNVFNHVKEMVDMRRGCYSNRSPGRAFPDISSGEEFFGLSIPVICKALEDLPGSDQLIHYRFKFKHVITSELPVVVYPLGCARTEVNKTESQVKKLCKLKSRNVSFSSHQISFTSLEPGLLSSPVKSKKTTSLAPGYRDRNYRYLYNLFKRQYLELRHGRKNRTYVGRSHIQGLGLFAAKDIDKDSLVLEYVGELIRNSVADNREKRYKSENRGVYMFRLNEDQVIDATRLGGQARYINHSCNPNCTAEIFEWDNRSRIIIITNSYVRKGEELTYDYRFDIEEDEHKLPCLCGSSHCRKFMN